MSDVQVLKGSIEEVDLAGATLEEWIQTTLETTELPEYFDDWLEYLYDEKYNEYLYDKARGKLYKVKSTKLDTQSFDVFTKNDAGGLDFVVGFYDGGTCLSEILSEALDKV